MRITKKVLSMILAFVMVLGLLPTTALATGEDEVYISVSFDGQYIDDKNGDPIVYIPVSFDEIASIDLEEYGLSDYLYDSDGDGNYEITALQLIIYAHENIYGGSWSDVNFTGGAGSSYFQGGIFGFTENLNYFLNGEFPVDEELTAGSSFTVGATSDHIVLEPGDFIDIASFSSFAFLWDSNAGFHLFADGDNNFTHNYTATPGEAVSVKLLRSYSNMADGSPVLAEEGYYDIYYGTSFGSADGTVTTDGTGCAQITFDQVGTYHLWCDGGYGLDAAPEDIVSSPAYATVTVQTAEQPAPEEPRQPQDISAVLDATMAELADTVTAPVFGTTAGEWTVLCLARGGYYAKDNDYFADYYDRIAETVNTTAAKVNLSGALHKSKSTDNSRLIVALSAIGKDATSVGNWDLVEAYSANGFSWIKKQGINGTIWALIALDSNNYATSDATIRQQCVDSILSLQHDDGGWSLMANKALASDPDITGMALQALYPYRDQPAVLEACGEAFTCLSEMQHDNGTFASGGAECSESCSWVIVACTTWGINPDTDSRFIKNGSSVVDALLTHYVAEDAMFQHIVGAGSNAMATDQSCYALIAYDRLLNNQPGLYDYSDVAFEEETVVQGKPTATLGLPAQITDDVGKTFNAVITLDQWDNAAGYKLIDFVMTVPQGLSVTEVAASNRLSGGKVNYHLEDGKLRVVYFDADNHSDLTVVNSNSGNAFPAQFFNITFRVDSANEGDMLDVGIDGMSVKRSSDSSDETAMIEVDTTTATGSVEVVKGISYSAVCLYTGDGIDLIPATKKAVAVSVVGIENTTKLTYNDGTYEYVFKYSEEITEESGIATYVALVDSAIAMEQFAKKLNFTFTEDATSEIAFGDSNGDGVINAQDALAAVDTWLRKGDAPTDDQILTLNVNGDSRINTFDALGIVEKFVDGSDFGVVTKAATLTTNP